MQKVLVTGATGFVGTHLVEALVAEGKFNVHGTVFGTDNLGQLAANQAHGLNLLDREAVLTLMGRLNPDWIFHLAALASPAASFEDPRQTVTNNIEAQINILDAAKTLSRQPRILIVGSAEEYGQVRPEELPINEQVSLRPKSPYAVSKIAQDFLGLQYFLAYGLPIVRVRPFNHLGEYQTESFVLPAFAKQVAEIEVGLRDPILQVGRISVKRDFTDVKDMVGAYILALRQGIPGEVYNLGSGRAVAIEELLKMLLAETRVKIRINQNKNKFRPGEILELRCDAGKFRSLTGWEAKIPLKVTVSRVLDYWRGKIAGER